MDEKSRRAIAHLAEALYLLSCVRDQGDTTNIPLHVGPADAGHTIHFSAKTLEAIADAVDSINAYMGSEDAFDGKLRAAVEQAQPAIDATLGLDEASMARRKAELMARIERQNGETIASGEWSAASVAQNDPEIYADVTDIFMLVDPVSYLEDVFNSPDAHASMNAYEELVTGEWDGEL